MKNSPPRKPSRREAQRQTAEMRERAEAPTPLPSELQGYLDAYRLVGVDAATWAAVSPVHRHVMERCQLSGATSFRNQCGLVAKYLGYRHMNSMSLAVENAFTPTEIDRYYLHGLTCADATRNQYRSRLTRLSEKVNPNLPGAMKIATAGHQDIRPGYTDAEMASIRRCVIRHRPGRIRQQLCVIVGLCAGAGLSSTDLRDVTGRDVVDHGDEGIEVLIAGKLTRTVWVRQSYEHLVRLGLEGVTVNQLVVGTKTSRKNVTTAVIAQGVLYDAPALDASRLRSTWLTWLLTCRAPIQVILEAAGLKTARSLTDLIAQLPVVDGAARMELRGDQS